MINTRISAVWSTNKQIEPFSCTPRVQEVYTKAEVVHLTPGILQSGRRGCAVERREASGAGPVNGKTKQWNL